MVLAETLNARQIPGVRFYPVTFTPASSKFAKEECHGVFILITDRDAVRPVRVGVEIASALLQALPGPAGDRSGATAVRIDGWHRRLKAGDDPAAIAASWSAAEARWRLLRAKYVIYRCPIDMAPESKWQKLPD